MRGLYRHIRGFLPFHERGERLKGRSRDWNPLVGPIWVPNEDLAEGWWWWWASEIKNSKGVMGEQHSVVVYPIPWSRVGVVVNAVTWSGDKYCSCRHFSSILVRYCRLPMTMIYVTSRPGSAHRRVQTRLDKWPHTRSRPHHGTSSGHHLKLTCKLKP